jgi:hypothetical protein
MRSCPVCESNTKIDSWTMEYLVPDGWGLPTKNNVCLCKCGMIYYNNDRTQKDYDDYYRQYYDSDTTLTGELTHNRLRGLANFIITNEIDRHSCIVDFGGGEGYLGKYLSNFGYTNIRTVNVGEELPLHIDLLVCSHVLEHVYDLHGTMKKLTDNVWGRILIDVPNASEMTYIKTLPILDFHQKHINHFTIRTMNLLLDGFGYTPVAIESYTVETHNYPSFRILYDVIDEKSIYSNSKLTIQSNVAKKISQLKKIQEPVIVYGCGDICLHLLAQVHLNIVHYMDDDPAFTGRLINGIPVYNHTESNAPIVVISQMQKELILERIKKKGLANTVIVI